MSPINFQRGLMSCVIVHAKLNQAVQSDPDLLRVFDELKATGDQDKDYNILYKALFNRAINMDNYDVKLKQHIAANNHIFEQQLQNSTD